jgi:hypothetical protein
MLLVGEGQRRLIADPRPGHSDFEPFADGLFDARAIGVLERELSDGGSHRPAIHCV